jgi:hypothetical protein
MNTQSHVEILTDDQLDQVAGGLDCNAAKALAAAYTAAAFIYDGLGDSRTADVCGAMAQGIRVGGCMQ